MDANNITPVKPSVIFDRAFCVAKGPECLENIMYWVDKFYRSGIIDSEEWLETIARCEQAKMTSQFRQHNGRINPYVKEAREIWWSVHYYSHKALMRKNMKSQ